MIDVGLEGVSPSKSDSFFPLFNEADARLHLLTFYLRKWHI